MESITLKKHTTYSCVRKKAHQTCQAEVSEFHHSVVEWRMTMKTIPLISLALLASNSFAEDSLMFKHGVEFNHKGHQTEKVGDCSVCHEDPVGKIKGFGKEWAHKNCIICHELNNEGRPGNCGGCHKTLGSLKMQK